MVEVRLRAIPDVPRNIDKALWDFLNTLAHNQDVLAGTKGDRDNTGVTFLDLDDTIDALPDIQGEVAGDIYGIPRSYSKEISTILKRFHILPSSTSYIGLISALEKHFYSLPGPKDYEKSITDIRKLIQLIPSERNYSRAILEIEKLINSMPSRKSYDQRIAALEQAIVTNLYNVREPFKYFLPSTVWDDLRFPVGSVRGAGAFPPNDTSYKSGIILNFDSGPNSQQIQFVAQMPHGYREGTNLYPHIHWTIPVSGAGLGAENVKWVFSYSWANIGDVFPVPTTDFLTIDVQSRIQDTHFLDYFAAIDGTGKKISSMLVCSLTRDVSVANDYGSGAYYLEDDFHFNIDKVGSRLEAHV